MENKKTISERINARFAEPDDGIFKDGKWRWWFVLAFGLALGSAIVTALIYSGSVGTIGAGVGVLVLWTLVGTLVYSDSKDSRLARGVSILDSFALCFVAAHFCFAMWAYGHLVTLRGAESKYEAQAAAYNAKAEKVSGDNVKIAEAGVKISENNTRAEKLKNDTAYQQRKTVERGGKVAAPRAAVGSEIAPSLSTAQIELEKPEKPVESSAAFLSRWDSWIRAANFGELILGVITLIYIRNRSAKFNAQRVVFERETPVAEFSPVATVSQRAFQPKPALRADYAQKATAVATDSRLSKLYQLRDHLRAVAFRMPGRFFKADLIEGGVSIRLCRKVLGADMTVKKTRQSNRILDAVDKPDFQALLIAELKRQGLIGKGGA